MKNNNANVTENFGLIKSKFSIAKSALWFFGISSFVLSTVSLYLMASFTNFFVLKPTYLWLYFNVWWNNLETVEVSGKVYSGADILEKLHDRFFDALSQYGTMFAIFFILYAIGLPIIFKKTIGKKIAKSLEDKHLRGTEFTTEEELKKELQNKSGYVISEYVKILREEEPKHILIAGSTGSGKTVLLKRLMKAQREHPDNKNAKFIIHDVKGDYLRQLYDPNKDFIYNFSDERGIYFNVFDYITDYNSLKSVVATIIPRSPEEKEPIWTDSARGIMEGILTYCIAVGKPTISEVKRLMKLPFKELRKELKRVEGTETAVQFLSASDTQVSNYMSNFISKAQFFDSIDESCMEGKEPFNIEEWLQSPGQSKLFMLNNVKDKDLNALRISVFVDTVIKIVLDFNEDKNRRIYLYMDELGGASNIPALETALILGRSFGLTVIIGIQELAKIDHIYGENLRKTMVNNLNTKILLRVSDSDTAKYLAELIGEEETSNSDKSNSIGSAGDRDSLSINERKSQSLVVLPSELQELPDLHFYFKQPTCKWVKTKTKWTPERDKYEDKYESFIKCKGKMNFTPKTPEELKLAELKEEELLFGRP